MSSDFKKLYEKHLRFSTTNGVEWQAHCPFHSDEHASMTVNVEKGLFHCHACGASGNYDQFVERLGVKKENRIIPEKEIEDWHHNILTNDSALKYLTEQRSISVSIINKYKIGYDGYRFTIPVKDKEGNYINVRRYRPGEKAKVVGYAKGYNASTLYPVDSLDGNPIYIMEGESDTLTALSLGLNAVTQTCGAMTWKVKDNSAFAEKDVYIVYDNDKAGAEGARRVAITLTDKAKSIRVVKLPLEKDKEDFTDFIVTYKHTLADFLAIARDMKDMVTEVEDRKKYIISDEAPAKVDLFQSSHSSYYGKAVEVPVLVVGKDLSPYILPQEIEATCSGGMKKCQICPLGEGVTVAKFDKYSPDILEMVLANQQTISTIITRRLGALCNRYSIKVIKGFNIEDVSVVKDVEYLSPDPSSDHQYVMRRILYVGHGIKTNTTYTLTGRVYPEPQGQHATILVSSIVPKKDSINSFKLTKETIKDLKTFQRKE